MIFNILIGFCSFFCEVMDDALYLDFGVMKVQQQTEMLASCFQIVQALSHVEVIKTIDRLELEDDLVFNK